MEASSVARYFQLQLADHLEVFLILRYEGEAVFDGGGGDQRIEGPQTIGFRLELEQLVGAAGNVGVQIRVQGISANEAVNAVGVPLVSCTDDEFMRGNDRDGDVLERIDVSRGIGFRRDTSIITSVSIR